MCVGPGVPGGVGGAADGALPGAGGTGGLPLGGGALLAPALAAPFAGPVPGGGLPAWLLEPELLDSCRLPLRSSRVMLRAFMPASSGP